MKGLTNVGNSCYLNAALQCLLHVPALTNYVLGGWADKDVSRRRVNACALALEYSKLVKAYWGGPEPAVIDTLGVWTALAKLHKPFSIAQPHDAHEALTVVLQHLHEAWCRTPRIRPSLTEGHVNQEAWEAHLSKNGYSIVPELFQGQTECIVEDTAPTDGTGYRSRTYEHFMGLSLDITGCSTLSQALTKAFAPETVDRYTLEDGTETSVSVTRLLVYAPAVLVLHLKRFDTTGDKIDRYVEYSTTLDVPGHGTYELASACFHRDGHYVAAGEVMGQWHAMDDLTVNDVTFNAIVNKDAYMLVFKKRLD